MDKKQAAESASNSSTELPSALDLGLAFHLKDNNELWVEFNPLETTRELSKEQFAYLTYQQDFLPEDFPLIGEAVAVLLDAVRRREPREICISIPTDARLDVFVSPNKLLAGMVLHGAQGRGAAIDRVKMDQLLKKSKVTRGLLDDALEQLLNPKLAEELRNTDQVYCTVIAYGESHENGIDGRLETLIKDASDRRPIEDEHGRINFLEKGDFPFIEENTPLLRRYPPTKGKPGWTVTGKTVRAKDGKDLQFKIKDATVKVADDDENLLVSAVAGMPVLYDKGAQIEQILKINQVDVETGHIRYRGSIEIKGDVRDGMQVVATGDIKIGGGVDAAFIKAGGHIELLGGAIGHKDAEYLTEKAALKAECSIKARFAHEAMLEAGQEIIISNQVMHSSLVAGTFIQILGKGQAVGGRLKAVDYIELNTCGAVAYSEMELEVGECSALQETYTELLARLNQIDDQKYKLLELARKTRQQGRQQMIKMKDKLIQAKEQIQARQREINTRLSLVESELKRFYAARITVNRRAYPGTLITIAGKKYDVDHELDKVTFVLQDDKVFPKQ